MRDYSVLMHADLRCWPPPCCHAPCHYAALRHCRALIAQLLRCQRWMPHLMRSALRIRAPFTPPMPAARSCCHYVLQPLYARLYDERYATAYAAARLDAIMRADAAIPLAFSRRRRALFAAALCRHAPPF